MISASDKHRVKDRVVSRLKEVEGRITNHKICETEGKLQKVEGKAKDRVTDLREALEDRGEG